ncbi:hypothetical protein [Agromyces sp. ZXT2-6]|uniref:hypothetical protein n=1 Tax=Agromyces sp. ZXT2-6 TaxID=3461153 RepID=UPI004054D6C5
MVGRRRHQVEDQQPLGPDDDPYLAYLLWREEREAEEAAARAEAGEPGPDEPEPVGAGRSTGLRSLFGRLSARRHVNGGQG